MGQPTCRWVDVIAGIFNWLVGRWGPWAGAAFSGVRRKRQITTKR